MSASAKYAARAAANFFCSVLDTRFLVVALFSILPLSLRAINLVVDSWGNLTANQQTVTQAVLDDWEALLPHVSHDVHLTFNFVDLSAASVLAMDRPDAEWTMATVTNVKTKAVEQTAIGVSFNFTQDGDLRPISSDIEMNANASLSWYVGLGTPPGGQYDWYSVMSHEVCHTIGFTVYYTRFSRNVTSGPSTLRTYNSGGTPTATLVNASSGTHLSSTYHPDYLMVPSIGSGTRRTPSTLESDMLWHDVWDYPYPDLTFGTQLLSVTGTTVGLSLRVWNVSATTGCDASHVAYYLSVNTTISGSDYGIGSDYVAPLGANTYSSESVSVDVRSINPPIPPGTYYVGFRVDDDFEVAEANEANNTYAFATQVTITQMSAPAGVSATDGAYTDRIRVTWNAVDGATHYMVYRGTSSSSAAAAAITGWQTATSYDDFLASGDRYYYWVKAAASSGGSGESGFSAYNSGYVLPLSLTTDSAHTVTNDPTFYYTDMSANDTLWWVVGVRCETEGENWSLRLYSDPACDTELVASAYEERVDFVVVDGHHVADTDRGVQCYRFRGSHAATVEFEGFSETLSVGSNAGISWPAGDVVEMWTVNLAPGTYRFDLAFNSGTNDLDFALFDSGDGDFFRTRHEYAGKSDNPGGAVDESFLYTVTSADNYGLCVWANGTTVANFDITITPLAAGLWEGDVSSDWHTPGNWNDVHVPGSGVDVVIPSGTPYNPVISAAAADCRNLTIAAAATLTMTDKALNVDGDLTCFGTFVMSQTLTHAYITDDVRWETGSSCSMVGSARIHLGGDWEFKSGASVALNSGYVEFDGATPSWMRSYESGCKMYNVVCNKSDPGYVAVSSACVDDLRIHNLYLWDGVFHSYSFWPVVIEGFLNNVYNSGHFQWHDGSLVLAGTGSGTTALKPNTGDFLETLVIDSDAVIECSTNYVDTLVVNGDVLIRGGAFRPNNVTLEVGGSWSNGVGAAGFEAGTDTVRFVGDAKGEIKTDETFYYLYLNKGVDTFDGLQITTGKTVRVLNDLYLNDGTLELNDYSRLDINDDLYIVSGAGLNANDLETEVRVADEWFNLNTTFSTTVGFDPGYSSTVIFDGGNNQYMYAEDPAAAEVFANLVIDKSAGNFMADEPIHVRGDCTIMNGGWSRFDASAGMRHRFDGDLLVRKGGSWLDVSAGSTVSFEGSASATVAYEGVSGGFNEVLVAKTAGALLSVGSALAVNGSQLHVDSGILELDANTLTCAGGVTVDADGELRVNLGATLSVGGGNLLNVTGGGILSATGGRGGNALITRNGSGYFSFYVQGGSTIGAQNCTFEYMDANGVYVFPTGVIDPDRPFNDCTFRNGSGSGAFMRIDNSEKHTVINAVFPTTMAGGYNVAKTVDAGNLKFVHATGAFAGETFDYDPYNRIAWASGAITSLRIVGPTHCTLGGSYLFRAIVSGDSVLTPISYSCVMTDLPTVNHYHSAFQDMVDASWALPGAKLLRFTASNDAGSLATTHSVQVAELAIQEVAPYCGGCNLTLSGTSAESTYYVEFCTNLHENVWIQLDDVAGADGTTPVAPLYGAGGVPSNAPAVFFRGVLKEGGL